MIFKTETQASSPEASAPSAAGRSDAAKTRDYRRLTRYLPVLETDETLYDEENGCSEVLFRLMEDLELACENEPDREGLQAVKQIFDREETDPGHIVRHLDEIISALKALEAGTDPSQSEEARKMKLSVIFEEKPERWGFRGDPYFWDHLKQRAEQMDLISPDELEAWIKQEFFSVAGKPMTDQYGDYAIVRQFAHGGMSSGGVDNLWWVEEGIPLLKSRLAAL